MSHPQRALVALSLLLATACGTTVPLAQQQTSDLQGLGRPAAAAPGTTTSGTAAAPGGGPSANGSTTGEGLPGGTVGTT
ncbi:MAG: hypothetical protein JWO22_3230, partial [Frankiales bacterium]|nr:hypothetical protein [Frankiales bacterium]